MPLMAMILSPIFRVPSRSAEPPDLILVTISGRAFDFSSLKPPRTVNPYELFSFSSCMWTVWDLTAWCGWIGHGGRLYSNSRQRPSPAFLIRSMISSCLRPCVLMPFIEMIMSPIWSSSERWAMLPAFRSQIRGRLSLSVPPAIVRPNWELLERARSTTE